MKITYCSFCRTQQNKLFGLTGDPDAYAVCENCLNKFSAARGKRIADNCCFCAESGKTGFMNAESGAVICVDCVERFMQQHASAPAHAAASTEESGEIEIDWPVYLDASMDLITVKIKTASGDTLQANFTTPGRIPWEMDKGKRTGEWVNGTCYWHPDLVFVEDLNEEQIRKTVEYLSQNNLLKQAFRKI